MNATVSSLFAYPRIPILDLLNPRRQTRFFVLMLAFGLIVAGSAMRSTATISVRGSAKTSPATRPVG